MSTQLPLLVGAGSVPEKRMRDAAEALARRWKQPLATHPVGTCPTAVLSQPWQGLIRLSGDPARQGAKGGHWLEAIADWRQPMLLLVPGEADGNVPGLAAAYTALCQQLDVPLMGLVQIQGCWNADQRRRDGLAWCGWIPAETDPSHGLELDRLCACMERNAIRRVAREAATVPV